MVIAERGWGLLQQVQLPAPIAIALSVLALDFAIYLQHLLFHTVPWLWRLHLVHHADTEFDVTTAVRFHPIEIVISMLWKLACIAMLGPPAVAVLIFEVLLNATAMFNHANARLPQRLEPIVRWVIVTPDMHRVHHSTVRAETNSNFGFNLPWWDRMLGTYCDQPAAGHDAMQIGLDPPPAPAPIGLGGLLALPFRAPQSAYPLARRDDASDPGRPT
jgi:sterol desaturase/sphingolipid hydroxylase (fatty acid hydroxylase superfamily)